MALRKVLSVAPAPGNRYTGYESKANVLTLECGHTTIRNASVCLARRIHCRECAGPPPAGLPRYGLGIYHQVPFGRAQAVSCSWISDHDPQGWSYGSIYRIMRALAGLGYLQSTVVIDQGHMLRLFWREPQAGRAKE
jgi:hypothetical protein